jgi:hypothetical protein
MGGREKFITVCVVSSLCHEFDLRAGHDDEEEERRAFFDDNAPKGKCG